MLRTEVVVRAKPGTSDRRERYDDERERVIL